MSQTAPGETTVAADGGERSLHFPWPDAPATGEVRPIADGVLWMRVPLPFQLNHVNIYLVEDDGGWAVIDTGIDDEITRNAWEKILAGPLAGQRITRIFATHFHPDHIGLAGWLCRRFDAPLFCSQTTYLSSQAISLDPESFASQRHLKFYARHGLPHETAAMVASDGHAYLRMVSELPETFTRRVDGDVINLGGRRLEVIGCDGHAPEQLTLHDRAAKLYLAGDQVIAKITPNISVWAVDPDGDPLGLFLRSLERIAGAVDPDSLVLPGHRLPFRGIDTRCRQIIGHHEIRCELMLDALRAGPRSVGELVPALFSQKLDAHQLGFAFSETHAHVNYLVGAGKLLKRRSPGHEFFELA